MQDDPQMTADPQVESEIVPRIAGLEWVEKSDAVDVLATRQTRTAMTQEKLTRGPRQTGAVNHWSASKTWLGWQAELGATAVVRLDMSTRAVQSRGAHPHPSSGSASVRSVTYSDDFLYGNNTTMYERSVDMTANDIASVHEETYLEKLVRRDAGGECPKSVKIQKTRSTQVLGCSACACSHHVAVCDRCLSPLVASRRARELQTLRRRYTTVGRRRVAPCGSQEFWFAAESARLQGPWCPDCPYRVANCICQTWTCL